MLFFALYTLESVCYIHTPHRVMCCMSTLNEYRSCLNELVGATPRKKAARMRSLPPSIEAALSSCQTLKDIWVVLEDRGLGMAYRAFQMTVWRARRSKKATAPRSWDYGSAPQRPGQQTDPLNVEGRDPLENLKRLEENRPWFHWRGTNPPSQADRYRLLLAESTSGQKSETNTLALDARALSAEQGATILPIRSAVVEKISRLAGVETRLTWSTLVEYPCRANFLWRVKDGFPRE